MLRKNPGPRQSLPLPLAGVRVIDMGIWHASAGGASILSELGAEVIKIESLEGDPERAAKQLGNIKTGGNSPLDDSWSLMYEITNRGFKKSICVDAATEAGREIVHTLAKSADVFITNIRGKARKKLKIDYDTLSAINEKLIVVSFTGYGSEGPMADVGGFDPMAQGVSGLAYLTGSEEPTVLQMIILDQLGSISVSHSVLAALYARNQSGRGQEVEVSLYGASIWFNAANILATSYLKYPVQNKWDRKICPPLRNSYKCKDGKWIMTTNHPESKFWKPWCEVTGMQHLLDDPRYATADAARDHYEALVPIFDAAFATKDRDEWIPLCQAAGLLVTPVQTLDEVLNDPQAMENEFLADIKHPIMGDVRVPTHPFRFSANSTRIGFAPRLGAHTDEVLEAAGYSSDAIAQLRKDKVVG